MTWIRLALLVLIPLAIAKSAPSEPSTFATPLAPSSFDVGAAPLVAVLPAGSGTPGGPLLLAPSGDAIAFSNAVETDALAILDLADGRVRQIGQGMTRPVWSPSGDALLVGYTFPGERLSSVAVVDRASGTLRPITMHLADGARRRDVPAGWIGQNLYYQRTFPDQPDRVEIHRVAIDGSGDVVSWSATGIRVLTDRPIPVATGFLIAALAEGVAAWHLVDPSGGDTPLDPSPLSQRITHASVGPGGDLIAYAAGVQLVVAPTANPGAAVAILPFGQGPGSGFAWSPTGDRLVVSDGATLTVYAGDRRAVLTTSANSGGIPIGGPLWLPDGIYFLQRGGEIAVRRLAVAAGDAVAWPPLPMPTDYPATIAALSTGQAAANDAGTAAALAADATVQAGATKEAAFAATTAARATQAADIGALATANVRSGAAALATADAQALAAALAAEATIQSLAATQAALAATTDAQATEAARVGAIATANAMSGADTLATAQAQATVVAAIAAVATQNAQSGANALATAEAEASAAQTALAAAQATGAALATQQAATPLAPIVIDIPTTTPAASPAASMSQRYVEVTVQVNPDGLLAGDGGAEDAARDALHAGLDRFAGCRVGVVSTFGGGGDGVAISRAVNDFLFDEFPDLFGGAAAPDDFFDQTLPRGAVTLRLYFFSGCAAAETPPGETPTAETPAAEPSTTPGIELRPA